MRPGSVSDRKTECWVWTNVVRGIPFDARYSASSHEPPHRPRGLGGDDRIRGGGGDDVIRGGAGDDRLEGGAGTDVLADDAGRDGWCSVQPSHNAWKLPNGGSRQVEINDKGWEAPYQMHCLSGWTGQYECVQTSTGGSRVSVTIRPK
jgi:hypothetical protein